DLIRIAEERFPRIVRNVRAASAGIADEVLVGVRPGTVDRMAHHHQDLRVRPQRVDLFDQVAIHRGIACRRFAADLRTVWPAATRERDDLAPDPARPRIVKVREVPVELGRFEAGAAAVLQAAEEEQLLRFGKEDFRMLAEDRVQPRGAGSLRADDEEIGKAVERQPFAGDLAVSQALLDLVWSQRPMHPVQLNCNRPGIRRSSMRGASRTGMATLSRSALHSEIARAGYREAQRSIALGSRGDAR